MSKQSDIPLYKHVYQVFFADNTSIRVMAFDKADAEAVVKKLKPEAKITRVKKIAD